MSKQVVVLGGGYAGVMAANRLAAPSRRAAPVVVIVTTQPRFVERIRLHEYAAGARSAPVHAYESLLHPDDRLQIASARRIDARQRLVEVDTGDGRGYD
ncbi:hypothetical protein [Curtobacterium sp. ME12]|uniref:hypothetical protein n=1 Tax=Curtobacterium sp. ME12 TaxID=2744253 RepID=UPI0015F42A06|nr:hypothetical protein [Curtobacterium sp. ME12]